MNPRNPRLLKSFRWFAHSFVNSGGTLRRQLPQALLVDLVGACERQLLKEKDTPRMLVGGAISQSELLEFFFGGLRARPQHDEGARNLALNFLTERHDQGLVHRGMALE